MFSNSYLTDDFLSPLIKLWQRGQVVNILVLNLKNKYVQKGHCSKYDDLPSKLTFLIV